MIKKIITLILLFTGVLFSDDYYIGTASAKYDGDEYQTKINARLRALNDVIMQIYSSVNANSHLLEQTKSGKINNIYRESVNSSSKAIVREWEEIDSWWVGDFYWVKLRVKKSNVISMVDEPVKKRIVSIIDTVKEKVIKKQIKIEKKPIEAQWQYKKKQTRMKPHYPVQHTTIMQPLKGNQLERVYDKNDLNSGFFMLRRKFSANEYFFYKGAKKKNAKNRLSVFLIPKGKSLYDFMDIKFYTTIPTSHKSDITDVYYDKSAIYAENTTSLYFHDDKKGWNFINKLDHNQSMLTIDSSPRGAQLFINNKYVGLTPYNVGKISDPYVMIRLKKSGFYIQDYFLSLSSGKPMDKKIILNAMPLPIHGIYLDPETHMVDDDQSLSSLDSALIALRESVEIVKVKIKIRGNSNELTKKLQKNRNLLMLVENYHKDIKNRMYSQYFMTNALNLDNYDKADQCYVLNTEITRQNYKTRLREDKDRYSKIGLDRRMFLNGRLHVPINEKDEFERNIKQTYYKLSYKKIKMENKTQYQIKRFSILYRKKEYVFLGKCRVEQN